MLNQLQTHSLHKNDLQKALSRVAYLAMSLHFKSHCRPHVSYFAQPDLLAHARLQLVGQRKKFDMKSLLTEMSAQMPCLL